jgi:hypothetical protein
MQVGSGPYDLVRCGMHNNEYASGSVDARVRAGAPAPALRAKNQARLPPSLEANKSWRVDKNPAPDATSIYPQPPFRHHLSDASKIGYRNYHRTHKRITPPFIEGCDDVKALLQSSRIYAKLIQVQDVGLRWKNGYRRSVRTYTFSTRSLGLVGIVPAL